MWYTERLSNDTKLLHEGMGLYERGMNVGGQ